MTKILQVFFPWNWLPFILSILFQSSIFKFNLFCLDLTLYNLKTTLILSPQLVIMSWKMLLNHWILYFPSPNSYEDYRIGLVIHSLPNLFRSFTWPDDIKYWRKASQLLCSWVTELAFIVNISTYLGDWLEKKNVPAIIIKQQFWFAISTT